MKIHVLAKTGRSREFVRKIDNNHLIVAVNKQPIKGAANQAIIKSLASYFEIAPSKIALISGEKFKEKVFEVMMKEKQE